MPRPTPHREGGEERFLPQPAQEDLPVLGQEQRPGAWGRGSEPRPSSQGSLAFPGSLCLPAVLRSCCLL